MRLQIADKYAEAVRKAGVPDQRVTTAVLAPEGESNIGAALCRYAKVCVA